MDWIDELEQFLQHKNSLLDARQLTSTGAQALNLGTAMDAKVMVARVDLEVS